MKYYAIFKFCYNSYDETLADVKLQSMVEQVKCEESGKTWGFMKDSSSDIYESKDKAKFDVLDIRRYDKESRKGEWWKYNKYVHRYVIHECTPNGNWKLTERERKLATESKWYNF